MDDDRDVGAVGLLEQDLDALGLRRRDVLADVVGPDRQLPAAARAAAVAAVPIVNAGDGPGEHPTQALLDLFTIHRELGRVDGLHVVLCGDLRHGRTARSLALLLTLYEGVRISFVAPPVVQMEGDILELLNARGVSYTITDHLLGAVTDADVVYQTRIQKERFTDEAAYRAVKGVYVIDPESMARLRPDAIVMHPLPRLDEIASAVDDDPRAAYFRQARNGVQVRMALLDMVLS